MVQSAEYASLCVRSSQLVLPRELCSVDHFHGEVRGMTKIVAKAAQIDCADVSAAQPAHELEVSRTDVIAEAPENCPGRIRRSVRLPRR